MEIRMTVLQALAVASRKVDDAKKPTHAQIALQSDDGDNQLSLTMPLDRAAQFTVGSTVIVSVKGVN